MWVSNVFFHFMFASMYLYGLIYSMFLPYYRVIVKRKQYFCKNISRKNEESLRLLRFKQ